MCRELCAVLESRPNSGILRHPSWHRQGKAANNIAQSLTYTWADPIVPKKDLFNSVTLTRKSTHSHKGILQRLLVCAEILQRREGWGVGRQRPTPAVRPASSSSAYLLRLQEEWGKRPGERGAGNLGCTKWVYYTGLEMGKGCAREEATARTAIGYLNLQGEQLLTLLMWTLTLF